MDEVNFAETSCGIGLLTSNVRDNVAYELGLFFIHRQCI